MRATLFGRTSLHLHCTRHSHHPEMLKYESQIDISANFSAVTIKYNRVDSLKPKPNFEAGEGSITSNNLVEYGDGSKHSTNPERYVMVGPVNVRIGL